MKKTILLRGSTFFDVKNSNFDQGVNAFYRLSGCFATDQILIVVDLSAILVDPPRRPLGYIAAQLDSR